MQALLAHTKTVLSKALGVWPKAAVKVNYISKLLQNNAHHNLDPPPTLLTGLDVMSTLVDLQPQKMVQVRYTSMNQPGAELHNSFDSCASCLLCLSQSCLFIGHLCAPHVIPDCRVSSFMQPSMCRAHSNGQLPTCTAICWSEATLIWLM